MTRFYPFIFQWGLSQSTCNKSATTGILGPGLFLEYFSWLVETMNCFSDVLEIGMTILSHDALLIISDSLN